MALLQGEPGHDTVTIGTKGIATQLHVGKLIVYGCEIAALDTNLKDIFIGVGSGVGSTSFGRRLRPGDSWEYHGARPIDISKLWTNNSSGADGADGDGVTIFKPGYE